MKLILSGLAFYGIGYSIQHITGWSPGVIISLVGLCILGGVFGIIWRRRLG